MKLPPESRGAAQHAAAQGMRRRNLAYASFLYFGVMLAIAFLPKVLPAGSWLHGFVADHFGAAVLFGFVPALIVGVGSTFHLRRDRPLVVLAAFTLGVPVVLLTAEWPVVGDVIGTVYFGVFTLLALALPLRWFFDLRRRSSRSRRSGPAGQDQAPGVPP